jgi:hypothetical protein
VYAELAATSGQLGDDSMALLGLEGEHALGPGALKHLPLCSSLVVLLRDASNCDAVVVEAHLHTASCGTRFCCHITSYGNCCRLVPVAALLQRTVKGDIL